MTDPRKPGSADTSAAGAGPSYANKTVRNIAWLGSTQFVRQAISMATTIVLARYLRPDDYGIFAMTLFVNELAQLFVNFGIGSALVQRKDINDRLLSSCFWANVLIAAAIGAVVVAAGPWAASYFKQPLIAQLLMASAVNLAIGALLVIPQALLARALAFDQIALGATVGSLGGAVGTIALAAAGAGVWALVLQPLIGTTINLIYIAIRAGWMPRLLFDYSALRSVLRFSTHVLVDGLAAHVMRNLQQLIVAPVAGAAAMGLLTMAVMAAWMPVAQFTSVAARAIYPVFARLQDEKDRLHLGMMRTVALISMLAFPVLIGLASLADDVMPFAFGAQWQDSAPLVSVLCLLCVVHSAAGVAGSAMLAQGRSGTTMRISLVATVFVAVVLWSVRHRSIFDVTVALSISHGVVALVTLHFALRGVPRGWWRFLQATWRPLGCSLLMAGALWGLRGPLGEFSAGARLAVSIPAGAIAYLVATVVLNRDGWNDLWSVVARKRQARQPG